MTAYDPEQSPDPVPSPCTGVCTMHPATGLCAGCFRTLNEIAQWGTAGEPTKRAIWKEIVQRREHIA